MMKQKLLILVCFLILLSGIGIVNAETLTGTLSSAGSFVSEQTNYSYNSGAAGPWGYSALHVTNIEYTAGTVTLIHFDTPGGISTYGQTDPGLITTFTATLEGTATQIGSGTIGYQRLYSGTPASEIAGYQYLIFDEWNVTGLTGTKNVVINYNGTYMSMTPHTNSGNLGVDHPTGYFQWGGSYYNHAWQGGTHGNVLANKNTPFSNDWSATKPAGLMIQGNVTKGAYGSRDYIINMDTGATVASESTVTTDDYSFDVFAGSIRIALFSSGGSWFNTSQLFAGTVTPTPTITPYPTTTPSIDGPIPDGHIRSKVQCVDSETDGTIHDCQLSLYNTNNNSWSNGTLLGTWFIDTLPGAVIDAYGTASGYTDTSRTGLPASGSTIYELIMHPGWIPPATTGKVHLYVIVNDYDTGLPVNGATVQVSGSGAYSQTSTTGRAGSVQFEWTNSSTVYVSASKAGYVPASRSGSTTAAGPDTIRIEIRKETVTTVPTSTIPPGGVTPVVTVDSRSSREKDMAMMDKIRNFAPSLIDICLLMTVIYLVGGKK